MKYILEVRKMKIENGLPVFVGFVGGQVYSTLRKAKQMADAVNSKKGETFSRATIKKA